MPKVVDKSQIQRMIMMQNKPFQPSDISTQMGAGKVSSQTVYNLIRQMIDDGRVLIDHKSGHKIYYGVASSSSSNSSFISNDNDNRVIGDNYNRANELMSLPVVERFSYVSGVVDMVIGGVAPSALVTGVAGIGKTYLVKQRLEEAGLKNNIDYWFINGYSTPMGLYRFLFEHRDGIIIFDDCDSVFDTESSINILKSSLDSYAIRRVNWQSERLPEDLESSFDFEGQIIFISNRDPDRIDAAIKSRTMLIDLQMSRKEIVEYIRSIYRSILPEISNEHKLEVVDYLEEIREKFTQFNLRTFIKIARIRAGAGRNIDWKKMALVIE